MEHGKYNIGTISYNRYGAFTNYGSILQTWALHQAISRLEDTVGALRWRPVMVEYRPAHLAGKDVLNPMEHMWDADAESRRLCEQSLPAIRENAAKLDAFLDNNLARTSIVYSPENLESLEEEQLDGFVCGGDTIFCIDESEGFDPGFFADCTAMRGRSVAYSASFGDSHFSKEDTQRLNELLGNFRALGLREEEMLSHCRENSGLTCRRVLDPTLLLDAADYAPIMAKPQVDAPYLLLYSRRYNPAMERYAARIAEQLGLSIVEISLRADNARLHEMRYDAGIEEFLSLIAGANQVVTNSFHAIIFSVQFGIPFTCFQRHLAGGKIAELLSLLELEGRLAVDGTEQLSPTVDFSAAKRNIARERESSLAFLRNSLETIA